MNTFHSKNTLHSKDGTSIVYTKSGSGPAIILVDGAFCSKDFGPVPKLAPLLANHFTVYAYDRRARGESGDTPPYTIARELEDLEALIDEAGGAAHLYGVSSGAVLSLRAAAVGLNVRKLVLFEPPFLTGTRQQKIPVDAAQQLRQMISSGRQKDAVKFYLRRVMGVPAIIPFILRLTPNWRKMIANANALSNDATIMGNFTMDKNEVASVAQQTLVIDSEKSPAFLREATESVAGLLQNGKRVSLKGQVHDVAPKVLAPVLVEFYGD